MRHFYSFVLRAKLVPIIVSLLFFSCQREKVRPSGLIEPQHNIEINFQEISDLDLTDLLSESQWIPLRDKNINSVSKASMGASFFTVFNESPLNEIINIIGYNYQGKPVFTINYDHPFVPNIMHVDDLRIQDDTLILLHRTAEKLIYLDNTGEYLGVNSEVVPGNAFFPLSRDHILFYSDSKDYHPISRKTGNAFYVFDSDSQRNIYSFAPFPPVFENMGLAIVPSPIFKGKEPNTALCAMIGQDTIFEARPEGYRPKYFIQFPNNLKKQKALDQLNRTYLELKGSNRDRSQVDREALDFIMNPNYLRAIDFVQEFDDYLLLIYSYGTKKRYLSLYNTTNGQCHTKSIPSLWNMYQNRFFQGDENHIFLIASDPETLFADQADLSLPANHIPEPGDEANPIVFKIRLDDIVQKLLG